MQERTITASLQLTSHSPLGRFFKTVNDASLLQDKDMRAPQSRSTWHRGARMASPHILGHDFAVENSFGCACVDIPGHENYGVLNSRCLDPPYRFFQ